MSNEYDLNEIFKSVWGYAAPPFLFGFQNNVENKVFGKDSVSNDFTFNEASSERREMNFLGELFYGLNNNGNEVFMPITLESANGKKFQLQNTVSSIACKKNIIETSLVGRQGTVKEEISVDDWEINVKGIIVSPDRCYPDQQVSDLNQLFLSGESYTIINARTSLIFGDKTVSGKLESGEERVVFKNLKFPELKGMKNVQAFECDLISDICFTLIIE